MSRDLCDCCECYTVTTCKKCGLCFGCCKCCGLCGMPTGECDCYIDEEDYEGGGFSDIHADAAHRMSEAKKLK